MFPKGHSILVKSNLPQMSTIYFILGYISVAYIQFILELNVSFVSFGFSIFFFFVFLSFIHTISNSLNLCSLLSSSRLIHHLPVTFTNNANTNESDTIRKSSTAFSRVWQVLNRIFSAYIVCNGVRNIRGQCVHCFSLETIGKQRRQQQQRHIM